MSEERTDRVRLVGGPYDGDQDDYPGGLPSYIWAYLCRCEPVCEDMNGVHWWEGDDQLLASQPGAEEYRYSHEEDSVHIYTWAPLRRHDSRRVEAVMSA